MMIAIHSNTLKIEIIYRVEPVPFLQNVEVLTFVRRCDEVVSHGSFSFQFTNQKKNNRIKKRCNKNILLEL